jgi:energy-coupling factor transporter ATP-binding protein EcfA2
MTRVRFSLSSRPPSSPRVAQVASLFDVEPAEHMTTAWDLQVPALDPDAPEWNVGLVVGPSGSGKSSLARELWPEQLAAAAAHTWSDDGALVDDFPAMPIKRLSGLLTSVGLGTIPAWLRPYRTLSNGEAFRASVARVLAETPDDELAVIDEFTSVVDRQVARVASHTVQKTVRRGGRRLVAVTCHYDVTDWLQPDWVLDMAGGTFSWRSVQPHPRLDLAVHKVDRSAWRVFARHHYLSGSLAKGAQCYGAFIGDECVAFTSYIHFPHPHTRNVKMGHRLVVLPDYQGLGIGGRLDDWLGQYLYERGWRYRNVVAHPAMIRYYSASPRWRDTGGSSRRRQLTTTSTVNSMRRRQLNPRALSTRAFEYTPPKTEGAER